MLTGFSAEPFFWHYGGAQISEVTRDRPSPAAAPELTLSANSVPVLHPLSILFSGQLPQEDVIIYSLPVGEEPEVRKLAF